MHRIVKHMCGSPATNVQFRSQHGVTMHMWHGKLLLGSNLYR
jgi:lysophospholipid acyltransferase (LPLAT)-like uncharacterized protein